MTIHDLASRFLNRVLATKHPSWHHKSLWRFRPTLEEMEQRATPARFDWTGQESSAFFDEDNWSQDAVPANDGSADIWIPAGEPGSFAPKAVTNLDLNSLHMLSDKELTLDRAGLTLRNGGEMTGGTIGPWIHQIDSTGGSDIRNITLAGGTFTWWKGWINPGKEWAYLIVQSAATLNITLDDRIVALGHELQINGGRVNITGSNQTGGTFKIWNGRGITNVGGTVTFTGNVELTRVIGGALNFDSAYIYNSPSGKIFWRNGLFTSHLPVANAGEFNVIAQAKDTSVTILNSSSNTRDVSFTQSLGQTLIEANGFNATMTAWEGYEARAGTVRGLGSSTDVKVMLMTGVEGSIKLADAGSNVSLYSGDTAHVDTVFVMAAGLGTTFGEGTNAYWYWKKVGTTVSNSQLRVTGNLTVKTTSTSANMETAAGTPALNDQATALTVDGVFTGTFSNEDVGGQWVGDKDNLNRKYVFTFKGGVGGGGSPSP